MPSHTSLYANTAFTSLLDPIVSNADANSAGVDLQNCDDAVLLFHIGAAVDTYSSGNKLDLEVQESDTDVSGNYTAVANADITNYVTGVNTGTVAEIIANSGCSQIYQVGYRGSKRYIRGVLNFSGTHSTGTVCGITALRGRNRAQPVNSYT
jgi:hypothetical protein